MSAPRHSGPESLEAGPVASLLGPAADPEAPDVVAGEPYQLRQLEEQQAAEEVLAYLARHPGSDAFDIAVGCNLDMDFVEHVAEQLVRDGRLVRGGHGPQ